jgi:hypothetical protein
MPISGTLRAYGDARAADGNSSDTVRRGVTSEATESRRARDMTGYLGRRKG